MADCTNATFKQFIIPNRCRFHRKAHTCQIMIKPFYKILYIKLNRWLQHVIKLQL